MITVIKRDMFAPGQIAAARCSHSQSQPCFYYEPAAKAKGHCKNTKTLKDSQLERPNYCWSTLQAVSFANVVMAILTACLDSLHAHFQWFFTLSKGEKQAGRATTHSLVSCLQSAPFTHQTCRVLCCIIQQNLCRGRWPEALSFFRSCTAAYHFPSSFPPHHHPFLSLMDST